MPRSSSRKGLLPQLPISMRTGALAAAGGLFLFAKWIPTALLDLTAGNMLGSAALMLLVLFIGRTDRILGLAAFLAVASLFLEQRRRMIARIQAKVASGQTTETAGTVSTLMQPAGDLIDGEVHPSEDVPVREDHPFKPSDDSESGPGSDSAEGIGSSSKHPLDTAGQDTEHIAELMAQKGFAAP